MFDFTKKEKLCIYIRWFLNGLTDYEFDLKRYVPIIRTNIDGTLYYLLFTKEDFQFMICKTEISEMGEIITNVDGTEFAKAFIGLFSKVLSKKRAEEVRMLAYSSSPFYSAEEISARWSRLIDHSKIKYAVTEQVIGDTHYSAMPYLLTKNCIGAFFVGPGASKDISSYTGDEKEKALEAANVGKTETRSDYGIGVLHYSDKTVVSVVGNNNLEISHFFHNGIIDVEEQVPRTTVVYAINILERLMGFRQPPFAT